jgi:sigma-B regulation protein RsbU (phosphoserine phosphatase)
VLFAAATLLYGVLWMSAVRYLPPVELGYDSDYLPAAQAQQITRVLPASPAERAGMRVGDRIVAIDGRPLTDVNYQARAWAAHAAGDGVRLTLEDPSGSRRDLDATFRDRAARGAEHGLSAYLADQIERLYPVPFVLVGLAVLILRIDDPKAWLLALTFAGFASTPAFPDSIDTFAPALRPFTSIYQGLMISVFAPLFYFFFATFPARSRLDRRFPWLKWAGLGAGAFIAAGAVQTGSLRLPEPLHELLGRERSSDITIWWLLATLTLGLVSLASNTFRSSDAETRRKGRLVFWGTVVALVPNLVVVGAFTITGTREPDWLGPIRAAFAFLLPLSLAYAVVKHRVLDVPVLLRRGARYLLVQRGFTIVLTLASIAATLAFSWWLVPTLAPVVDVTRPAGIAVGAAFGTLLLWSGSSIHRRIGERIDRAFFRQAYDARTILQDLANRAATITERAELATLLHRHVSDALLPSALAVYLRERGDNLILMAGSWPSAPPAIPASELWLSRLPAGEELAGSSVSVPAAPFAEPAEAILPIRARGRQVHGLVVLGPRRSEELYSREDTGLLALVAGQAALALENLALAEQIAERLEAERRHGYEIAIAQEVQQKLLPQRRPSLSTLEYAGTCTQARAVGGDYYDFLPLAPGRVGFVLADISGKGIAAALLMANLQAIIRSHSALASNDHENLLKSVNGLFGDATAPNRFATLFFGKYDDATGRLTYVNCGHNPPLVVRRTGNVEWLSPTAIALGLFDRWTCATATSDLAEGDVLVMYSDGITEAWSGDGIEYGEDRLVELVRANRGLPPDALVERVVSDVRAFSAGEQSDDWTLIAARRRSRDAS